MNDFEELVARVRASRQRMNNDREDLAARQAASLDALNEHFKAEKALQDHINDMVGVRIEAQ